MRKILLTGGSGTVGKEVLHQLCGLPDNNEVTVFDIRTKASELLYKKYGSAIRVVFGDLSDKNEVKKVCGDKDFVIHLAAIIPPLADKDPTLAKSVNVTGTRNLLESIAEQSPGAFFLYSSSISVYGDRCTDPWIKVTDPLIPSDRDEYALTKIEAEKLVRNSPLRWSIFRLTAIMGINNHKPTGLMFHMPLASKMEIATPGDTGRAFISALDHQEILKGNIYNLSGGEKCRIDYCDFLSRSFEIFGLGRLDFEENTFAGRNFHCGYYEDGDILNDILHFRRETIDDYFSTLKMNVPLYRKIPTFLFRRIIKYNMQKRSEPLLAVRTNNKKDMDHYF